MGKAIYNNKTNTDLVNYRQHDSNNQTNLGCFQLDVNNTGFVPINNSYQAQLTPLQKYNVQMFKNSMYTASYMINQNSGDSNVKVELELRIYSSDGASDPLLYAFASDLRDSAIAGLYNRRYLISSIN